MDVFGSDSFGLRRRRRRSGLGSDGTLAAVELGSSPPTTAAPFTSSAAATAAAPAPVRASAGASYCFPHPLLSTRGC